MQNRFSAKNVLKFISTLKRKKDQLLRCQEIMYQASIVYLQSADSDLNTKNWLTDNYNMKCKIDHFHLGCTKRTSSAAILASKNKLLQNNSRLPSEEQLKDDCLFVEVISIRQCRWCFIILFERNSVSLHAIEKWEKIWLLF